MKRQIIYPGAIPLETDLLGTNKNTMIGLGKIISAVFGTSTFATGLACAPTAPATLNVSIGAGEIYSLQNIDGTAYSSIAADTTHQIMKQGISLDAVQLSCPAPATGGNSINYLIQAAFSEVDGNAVVLPYYNASNPSQAYSGPANAGTTNNTTRDGTVVLAVKAGVSATTGSQVTPAPDSGYVGLWVVTVAYGATTIIAGNITQYASAPFAGNLQSYAGGRKALFTTTGSWTSPVDGIVYVSACAGGSGGGGGGGSTNAVGVGGGGAGGAAGQSVQRQAYTVSKGTVYAISVGAGGAGGLQGTPTAAGTAGGAGGSTSIASLVTLAGGSAAGGGGFYNGSSIGSGGLNSTTGYPSGSSGADGANGFNGGVGCGGMGASSPFGGGGGAGHSGSIGVFGVAAAGYGAGGGGGGGGYGGTGGGANGGGGGAGSAGFVLIEY